MELQYQTAFNLELYKVLLTNDLNLAFPYYMEYRKNYLVNCKDFDQLFRTIEVLALRATTVINETLIKIVNANRSQPEEMKKLKE